jgi:hypothetical protein
MKTRLIFAASSVFMLVASGPANSQQAQQEPQPCGEASMQQEAHRVAQAGTDTSLGGVPDTRTATASPLTERCLTGPQCNVLYGP